MRALSSGLRNQLESAVVAARRAAENASRTALDGLGVFADRRPEHLDAEHASLRNGLRAKWRQLGDDPKLLVTECAYEQWHRLLFARFLAENHLLRHPQYRAEVSLEDCEELAGELGEPDGWSVAARFAADILPGIFRIDDPCVRLRLAPEGREELERILGGLPAEVFVADDALGWVYQFWQRDKKDEVNASQRKIGAGDLGPVTQLFTENYMVRFLLENSLGAWWATRNPDSPLVREFAYLRFDDAGKPAAGSFDGWPESASEVRVMDPCCGSGHFLVEAFLMLWRMRAEQENLNPTDAQDAVLRDNLFGLELDERCTQIAAFNIAFTAWKTAGYRQLPTPNVACSGIRAAAPLDQWLRLARDDSRVEGALKALHSLFREADTLGSLIDPRRVTVPGDLWSVDYANIAPALEEALAKEGDDPASAVFGRAAAGVARAAALLTADFTLVVTNVPYLSRSNQGPVLRSIADRAYPLSKHDLATSMLERLMSMSSRDVAAVLPQGWTQLSRYRQLRDRILEANTLRSVAFLGPGAFTAISGEVVNVILFLIAVEAPRQDSVWNSLDVSRERTPATKARQLQDCELIEHRQSITRRNPDARIVPDVLPTGTLLAAHAKSLYGLRTGDGLRLIHYFWELDRKRDQWRFHQSTTELTRPFAGREHVLLWEFGKGALAGLAASGIASIQGEGAWGRSGVVVSLMSDLPVTRYTGESFDNNCAVVWPNNPEDLGAIWAFLSHPSFSESVRRIDRSLKVTNQTLLKVPFDLETWRQVALDAGQLVEPFSADPTQWLFDGRPETSSAPLHVAVGRLLGYRWPKMAGLDDLDGLADTDGIACLPPVAGEPPAVERLQRVLAAALGERWTPAKAKDLLEQAGSKKNLADWLRDDFFKQHCALFGNRPFVWHVWDGQTDGFSSLVNYHQLNRKLLEKLTYTYLGQDWVERQRAGVRDQVPGAEARLNAALVLQHKLEAILTGERPNDIYVRWKELRQQAIGWEPDLNDGVRLNIRPFVEAGVLRSPFNINWKKDRGLNSDGSERLNDLHKSLAEKGAARTSGGRT